LESEDGMPGGASGNGLIRNYNAGKRFCAILLGNMVITMPVPVGEHVCAHDRQQMIGKLKEALSGDLFDEPLSPEERKDLTDLLGQALIALGMSKPERLHEVYEAIANLASESALRPGFAELVREMAKRNNARSLQRLEATL
jgi:hypothetical protein